jgi:hypothetical protein
MHLLPGVAIQPNLQLKTRPKQLLGSLPLDITLPASSYQDRELESNYLWLFGPFISYKENEVLWKTPSSSLPQQNINDTIYFQPAQPVLRRIRDSVPTQPLPAEQAECDVQWGVTVINIFTSVALCSCDIQSGINYLVSRRWNKMNSDRILNILVW